MAASTEYVWQYRLSIGIQPKKNSSCRFLLVPSLPLPPFLRPRSCVPPPPPSSFPVPCPRHPPPPPSLPVPPLLLLHDATIPFHLY